ATLGGAAVRGRGRIFGARAVFTLPGNEHFFHSFTAGLDYKLFLEDTTLEEQGVQSNPVHYWPLSANYGASFLERTSQTNIGLTAVFNIRGLSSPEYAFDAKRYKASGSFAYVRGEVSRTDDLPGDIEIFVRASGQYTGAPLVSPEQFTAGGLDTVRGYLEVEAAGDFGALGTFEVRSPSLGRWLGPAVEEWRFHVFTEGG